MDEAEVLAGHETAGRATAADGTAGRTTRGRVAGRVGDEADDRARGALADDARHVLRTWRPHAAEQDALRREYLTLVEDRGGRAVDRAAGPEHLTASCFVLTADLARVLLCFHRKGQFWVQLGGHTEPGDRSLAGAALREAREESGLDGLVLLGDGPVDLDRHGLGDGFARCAVHWDVGFAAVASATLDPVVSEESEDVAWWPVDALPGNTPPGFPARLAGALAALGSPARG